jgi:putative Mg2+ transporter-C (MgtC) family protein
MPTSLEWSDVALRLALAVAAGALIGFDRGEHGRPAGLRTTLLVCLAACVAMVQANLLLGTAGRRPDAFTSMDVMRLPLGILSGTGFIGAGAIIRRDDLVLGVTTAATLWFVTVIGLCFGGGQLGLGLAALCLCLVVLWVLKWAVRRIPQDHRATLVVAAGPGGPAEEDIRPAWRTWASTSPRMP